MARICEHCGSDTYFAENFDRLRDYNDRLSKQIVQERSRTAIAVASKDLKIMELEERMKWLQRKVAKQKDALRKIQEKKKRTAA